MIQKGRLWRDLEVLPPAAQRQVADFIVELTANLRPRRDWRGRASEPLASEAFIGIWKDREELTDSSGWVRELREREWRSQ